MTWRARAADRSDALDDYGRGRGRCTRCGAEWFGHLVCHCPTCHLTFTAVGGFDYHRIGGSGDRRCRTPAELRDGGYETNEVGQWRRPAPAGTFGDPP